MTTEKGVSISFGGVLVQDQFQQLYNMRSDLTPINEPLMMPSGF